MKIGNSEFLIGADPECFVREIKSGKLVSAHGMLPGTKKNPHKVPHGAVQIDGMAAEFNIDPAATCEEFVRNVTSVLNTIREMIGPEYELVFTPTAHFGKELIDAQPQEAKELGCDPDFNAYTGKENPVPDAELPFRTAAGHIHIGWTEGQDSHNAEHYKICRHIIKQLDYATLPTTQLENDDTRRKLYGKAGAFRPKSYGVEYRTPSNFWLESEETISLMYIAVTQGIKKLVSGEEAYSDSPHQQSTVRSTFDKVEGVYQYDNLDCKNLARKFGYRDQLLHALEAQRLRPQQREGLFHV